MSHLKIWQQSIQEYCTKTNKPYIVPKKGTEAYKEIRKIYDDKIKNKDKPERTLSSKCKCRCPCSCKK